MIPENAFEVGFFFTFGFLLALVACIVGLKAFFSFMRLVAHFGKWLFEQKIKRGVCPGCEGWGYVTTERKPCPACSSTEEK